MAHNCYDCCIGPNVGGAVSATPHRMFTLSVMTDPTSDTQHTSAFPSAGGPIDGCGTSFGGGVFACQGWPVLVEAGGAFSGGDSLQTDAVGRAVLHTSGVVVMRALEAAFASGNVVQAVFAR